jgi:hypothetical protein
LCGRLPFCDLLAIGRLDRLPGQCRFGLSLLDVGTTWRVENGYFAGNYLIRMSGLICRILGAVAAAATLFLSGCNFGADNVGDIYGSSQPAAKSSEEHTVPESQKSGTVSGEAAPDRVRLGQ